MIFNLKQAREFTTHASTQLDINNPVDTGELLAIALQALYYIEKLEAELIIESDRRAKAVADRDRAIEVCEKNQRFITALQTIGNALNIAPTSWNLLIGKDGTKGLFHDEIKKLVKSS